MARKLRTLRYLLIPCALVVGLAGVLPAQASSWIVNTANDTDDGTCDLSHCSLREAINAANENPGPDTISFSAFDASEEGVSIDLLSALPPFTDDGTTLDGTTVQGYAGEPVVSIVGALTVSLPIGLDLQSDGNVIRGLSLARFGVYPEGEWPDPTTYGGGAISVTGSGNVIEGNVLGFMPLQNSVGLRLLGGGNSAIGNVIGCNGIGIYIHGPGQVIQGNQIGTEASGNLVSGNRIGIFDAPGSGGGHLIGGPGAGEGNLISDNPYDGVVLNSAGNVVQGNRIGTNATGTAAVGNDEGIYLNNSPSSLIGGSGPGEGNLISGNTGGGILVTGDCQGTRILGNLIGSDVSGSAPVPNEIGIQSFGSGIVIGGLNPGEGNIVFGNGVMGLWFEYESDQTRVLGNTITQNGDDGINGYVYLGSEGFTYSRNSIFDNGGLGIFGGHGIDAPEFTETSGHHVEGTACSLCQVELFVADPDPSGAGEGKTYITTVTADASGHFDADVSAAGSCQRVTATATSMVFGNTSEFAINMLANCLHIHPPFLYPLWVPVIVVFAVGGYLFGRRNPARRGPFTIGGLLLGVAVAGGLTFLGDALPGVVVDFGQEETVLYQGQLPDCSSFLDPAGFSPPDGATLDPATDVLLEWLPSDDLPQGTLRWVVHAFDTQASTGTQATEATSLPLSALGITPLPGDTITWSLQGDRLLPDDETWLPFCGRDVEHSFQLAEQPVVTEAPAAVTTPTQTPLPVCTAPTAEATVDLTCRTGPSQEYEAAGYLMAGESAAIEGRNADSTWWWILNPDWQGHCWVWSSGVEATCVPDDLRIIAAPPLPTATSACTSTLNQEACVAAGGTWELGATVYCACP